MSFTIHDVPVESLPYPSSNRRSLAPSPKQHNHRSRRDQITWRPKRIPALREVVRARQRGVHDSEPILRCPFLDAKLQLVPIRIDHHVKVIVALRGTMEAERQAVRVVRQVGGPCCTVPGDILAPESATA